MNSAEEEAAIRAAKRADFAPFWWLAVLGTIMVLGFVAIAILMT